MSSRLKSTAILIVVMLSLMMVQVSGQSNELEIIVTDGRITGLNIENGQTYTETWTIKENEWYSVNLDCQGCTGALKFNGTLIDSSSNSMNGMVNSDGTMELAIESSIDEEIGLSIIHHTNDDFVSVRPSPSQIAPTISSNVCLEITVCMDHSRGNLASIPTGEFTSSEFITGIIDDGQSEYFAIDVSKGDTLELSLAHSSSDIMIEIYFQNQSEEKLLINNISSPSQLSPNQILGPSYWQFDNEGRALVKVESQSIDTCLLYTSPSPRDS